MGYIEHAEQNLHSWVSVKLGKPGDGKMAEPHAGCCGDWGVETPGYPIMFVLHYHKHIPNNIHQPSILF